MAEVALRVFEAKNAGFGAQMTLLYGTIKEEHGRNQSKFDGSGPLSISSDKPIWTL